MDVRFSDGLPDLGDSGFSLSPRIHGLSAFVRSPRWVGRLSLQSGVVEWLVERATARIPESTWNLPRWIQVSGSDFWISESGQTVAEIISTECGGLAVSVRDAASGNLLWERFVPIPEAADWAETSPAWPGAQTEEIYGFLADDTKRFVVCLFRQSRRTHHYDPKRGWAVPPPPYACQTDAVRFDPLTGNAIWRESFQGVRVEILERRSFTGIWSNSPRLGMLDFESGTNRTIYESPNLLGWPVLNGSVLSVPWHSKREVGVDWIDERGTRVRNGAWRQSAVRSTQLRATGSGLALQTNDQMVWWLGKEDKPLWSIRAKPYVYRVHSSADTDIFVGTDGRGGRLLGFDAASGRETLNLKPALGGVGDLTKVPGHDVLVATFRTSRADSKPARLLVLSMKDRHHELDHQCWGLIGAWEHGAVFLAGGHRERLAIVDVSGTDS